MIDPILVTLLFLAVCALDVGIHMQSVPQHRPKLEPNQAPACQPEVTRRAMMAAETKNLRDGLTAAEQAETLDRIYALSRNGR